jgi:hypothetical protein
MAEIGWKVLETAIAGGMVFGVVYLFLHLAG